MSNPVGWREKEIRDAFVAFPAGILAGEAAGRPPPRPCCGDGDMSLRSLSPPSRAVCKPPQSGRPGKQLPPLPGLGMSCPGERDRGGRIRTGCRPPGLQSAGRLRPLEGDASPGHGKPLGLRVGFRPAGRGPRPSRSSPCQKKSGFSLKLKHPWGSPGKSGAARGRQPLCLVRSQPGCPSHGERWHLVAPQRWRWAEGVGKGGGQPCCPVGCLGAIENTNLAVPGGMEILQL